MTVGEDDLQWRVRHWGGASNAYENHRGISVSVCVEPGRTKELLVEFAFTDYFFKAPPQQAPFERRLRSAVEAAIAEGWRPLSRGRAYLYNVPVEVQQAVPADVARPAGERRG